MTSEEISRKYGYVYAFIFATIKREAEKRGYTLSELSTSSGSSIHTVWRVLNDKYANKELCHSRAIVIMQCLGGGEQKVVKAVITELDKYDPDQTDSHIQALRKLYGRMLYKT